MRLRKDEIALVERTVNEPARSPSALSTLSSQRQACQSGGLTGEGAEHQVDQDEPVAVLGRAQVSEDEDRGETRRRVGDEERMRDGVQELLRSRLWAVTKHDNAKPRTRSGSEHWVRFGTDAAVPSPTLVSFDREA